MRGKFLFLFIVIVTASCAEVAKAQWQFCFGMSPGISKTFPVHPADGIRLPWTTSVTLHSGINYSFSRKMSAMFLLSFSDYNISWEGEVEGAYNYPLTKRVRIKSSAGIGAAFLHNTRDPIPEYVINLPSVFRYNKDNFFVVLKSGVQWKAPGKYHSVCFSVDYHWGILNAHRAIIYNTEHYSPSMILKGRGSYLALNMIIFIGKEKYSWKKSLTAKDKIPKSKSFVM
ncbi:MAG TPA: hypothetical protein VE978_16430 [Chitinophagales bacterium]|nr:hypothetical protein [Chitinophagales bacterium]